MAIVCHHCFKGEISEETWNCLRCGRNINDQRVKDIEKTGQKKRKYSKKNYRDRLHWGLEYRFPGFFKGFQWLVVRKFLLTIGTLVYFLLTLFPPIFSLLFLIAWVLLGVYGFSKERNGMRLYYILSIIIFIQLAGRVGFLSILGELPLLDLVVIIGLLVLLFRFINMNIKSNK